MKKLKVLIKDKTYKNGIVEFLNYYPELKSCVEIVKSSKDLEDLTNYTILSDDKKINSKVKSNNSVYNLSSNPVTCKNEIYKYSNIKNIITSLIGSNIKEGSEYFVYSVNSPNENSGKSLICKTMAEIISKNARCGLIEILETKKIGNEVSLSELILMSMKNKDVEEYLNLNDEGFYKISGFNLVRDYTEMEISNLKTLLDYLNKNLRIDFFIIELPCSLDKTSEEIIKMSKMNFIINDQRKNSQKNKLEYLKEIGEKAWESLVIENFCDTPNKYNEIPIIRTLYDEINDKIEISEKDMFLVKHKIAQCLGENYA